MAGPLFRCSNGSWVLDFNAVIALAAAVIALAAAAIALAAAAAATFALAAAAAIAKPAV